MAVSEAREEDFKRNRDVIMSPAHNPPRFVDRVIPTLETGISAMGGPGTPTPRAQGTHPWVAGSFTIGSNHVWNLLNMHFEVGSPNVTIVLRHNHSGTNAIPGGTLATFNVRAAGRTDVIGYPLQPLRTVREGTLFCYVFGARSALTGSTPFVGLGTNLRARTGVQFHGYIE